MNNKSKDIIFQSSSNLFPNDHDSDFKAEVIASSLIEQGHDPEQIVIIREGISKRGYSTDVNEVVTDYSMHDQQEYIHIKANKESLYDMLPQGLFHQPLYKKKFIKDREDALEEIKIHREQEFFARRFFQPFEIIADETLTQAYLYEAKYNKKIAHSEFIELFSPYWPILKLLEKKQANFFMYVIPILHHIRSHREETEEALSYILDVPVKLSNIKLPAKQAGSFFESKVGKNSIGVDMVLGNSFDDGEYDIKITVGPISALRMVDFIETGKGYCLLELLCDLFLPVGAFVEKEFKIIPEDSAFILSDKENTTFLGVNSFT